MDMNAVDIIFKVVSHRDGYMDKHTKNYMEAIHYSYLVRGDVIARIYFEDGHTTDLKFDLSTLI